MAFLLMVSLAMASMVLTAWAGSAAGALPSARSANSGPALSIVSTKAPQATPLPQVPVTATPIPPSRRTS